MASKTLLACICVVVWVKSDNVAFNIDDGHRQKVEQRSVVIPLLKNYCHFYFVIETLVDILNEFAKDRQTKWTRRDGLQLETHWNRGGVWGLMVRKKTWHMEC